MFLTELILLPFDLVEPQILINEHKVMIEMFYSDLTVNKAQFIELSAATLLSHNGIIIKKSLVKFAASVTVVLAAFG